MNNATATPTSKSGPHTCSSPSKLERGGGSAGYWLVMAVVAVVVLVMNWLTTLKGDEYVYALMPDDMRQHCTTLAAYLSSMPEQYWSTNGRLADVLERLFSSLISKGVFNVFNTVALLLLLNGIQALALGRRRNVLVLAATLLALLFCFPIPGQTLLWQAGAFNYLWSVVLSLWLAIWLKRQQGGVSLWQATLALTWGFVAGGFNESVSVGCLLAGMFFFILNPHQFCSARRYALVGYVSGLAMLLLSPALWSRLDGGAMVNTQLSLWQMMSRRVLAVGFMSLRFVTPTLAFVFLFHTWHRHGGWRAVMRRADYCLLLGAFMAAFMLGMLIERPYTWLVTVSMVVVARCCYPWLVRLRANRCRWLIAAALLVAAATAGHALWQMAVYRAYDRQVMGQVAEAPAQCVLRASSPPVKSRWVMPNVYDNDAQHCAYRTIYSYYFHKDNVQFLPEALWQRYNARQMLDGAVPTPFASSDTSLATALLTVPGEGYALMKMAPSVDLSCDGWGRIYRQDMEQVLGKDTSQRRYLLGSLKDHVPFRPYRLTIDGTNYLIVNAEVDDQVTAITVDIYTNEHKMLSFEFTRQTQ